MTHRLGPKFSSERHGRESVGPSFIISEVRKQFEEDYLVPGQRFKLRETGCRGPLV